MNAKQLFALAQDCPRWACAKLEAVKTSNAQFIVMEKSGDVFTWHVNPYHENQDLVIQMNPEDGGYWDAFHGVTCDFVGTVDVRKHDLDFRKCCFPIDADFRAWDGKA